MSSFEEANKIVHKVEDQWHYARLTSIGFVPETKERTGFVRSYLYRHADGRTVRAATGCNADHWEGFSAEGKSIAGGYWADLDKWVQQELLK